MAEPGAAGGVRHRLARAALSARGLAWRFLVFVLSLAFSAWAEEKTLLPICLL
jgi:hypothetical protein